MISDATYGPRAPPAPLPTFPLSLARPEHSHPQSRLLRQNPGCAVVTWISPLRPRSEVSGKQHQQKQQRRRRRETTTSYRSRDLASAPQQQVGRKECHHQRDPARRKARFSGARGSGRRPRGRRRKDGVGAIYGGRGGLCRGRRAEAGGVGDEQSGRDNDVGGRETAQCGGRRLQMSVVGPAPGREGKLKRDELAVAAVVTNAGDSESPIAEYVGSDVAATGG